MTDSPIRQGLWTFAAGRPRDPSDLSTPHLAPTTPESFETEGAPVDPDSGVPVTPDGVLAFIISQIFSPMLVAAAMVLGNAAVIGERAAWTWAWVYLGVAILVPIVYLLILLRIGWVSDLDVQVRAERIRPLQFTLAAGLAAWILLLLGRAPGQLVILCGALWVMMAINYLVTLRWKISMHTAFAAAGTTVVWILTGFFLPLVLGVPLMGWSRVRLGRHTPAQTVAGGALGFVIFFLARSLGLGRAA